MNDPAFSMQIIKAQEYLFCDLFNKLHWNTPMIPFFDQTQKVLPKHLEYHAHVSSIRALMLEGVQ